MSSPSSKRRRVSSCVSGKLRQVNSHKHHKHTNAYQLGDKPSLTPSPATHKLSPSLTPSPGSLAALSPGAKCVRFSAQLARSDSEASFSSFESFSGRSSSVFGSVFDLLNETDRTDQSSINSRHQSCSQPPNSEPNGPSGHLNTGLNSESNSRPARPSEALNQESDQSTRQSSMSNSNPGNDVQETSNGLGESMHPDLEAPHSPVRHREERRGGGSQSSTKSGEETPGRSSGETSGNEDNNRTPGSKHDRETRELRRNKRRRRRTVPNFGPRYKAIRKIGSGAYGSVFLAHCVATGQKVAIKNIENIFDDEVTAKRLLREIRILRLLKHPNIIGFHCVLRPESVLDFDHLPIVFEHVDTDLRRLVHSKQFLSELHIQTFLYQLLLAVACMHDQHIIHRDLKPANILVNGDCSLKICDFGLSRFYTPPYPISPPSPVSPSSSSPSIALPSLHLNLSSTPPDADSDRLPFAHALPYPAMGSKANSAVLGAASPQDDLLLLAKNVGPLRLSRQLTEHVVTRWYRAPELILPGKLGGRAQYTTAIDMWSVGCIFAELLSMLYQKARDRIPLFPGQSCAPLSSPVGGDARSAADQLDAIFSVLGTPTPEQLSTVALATKEKASKFLKTLRHRGPADLSAKFKRSSPEAITLLKKLLRFDPKERLTAREALQDPYLTEVRDERATVRYNTPPTGELGETFEFEEDDNLTQAKIRRLLVAQIQLDTPTWTQEERENS